MKVSKQLFEAILDEQLHKRVNNLLLYGTLTSEMTDAVRLRTQIAVVEVLRSGVIGHMSRHEAYTKANLVYVSVDPVDGGGASISFDASRLYTELYPPNREERIVVPATQQNPLSTRSGVGLPAGYRPPRPRPPTHPVFDFPVQELRVNRPALEQLGLLGEQVTPELAADVNALQDSIERETAARMATEIAEDVDRGIIRDLLSMHGLLETPNLPANEMTQDVAEAGGEFIRQQMREQGFMARSTPVNPIPERLRGQTADQVILDEINLSTEEYRHGGPVITEVGREYGPSMVASMVPLLAGDIMREAAAAQQRMVSVMGVPEEFLTGRPSSGAEARVREELSGDRLRHDLARASSMLTFATPVWGKETQQLQSIQEPRRKIEP